MGCIRKGQEGRVYLLFPQYPQLDTFLGDTGISTKGRGPKHGSCHSEENKFGAGYSQSECSSGLGRRALQKVCVTRSWLHRQNVQWGLHFFLTLSVLSQHRHHPWQTEVKLLLPTFVLPGLGGFLYTCI